MLQARRQRILSDMGLTVWQGRDDWQKARAAAGSQRATELARLLGSEAPAREAPAIAAQQPAVESLPSLGCLWIPGAILLGEAAPPAPAQRFLRDVLTATAALGSVDLGSPSQRATLPGKNEALWLTVAAEDLGAPGNAAMTQASVLGFLRKRAETAVARVLLLAGGTAGSAFRWVTAGAPELAWEDAEDPALSAHGARSACWRDGAAERRLLLLPPTSMVSSDSERKRRLWLWLAGQLGP